MTIKASEKEKIEIAITTAKMNSDNYINVRKDDLQKALDEEFKGQEITVNDNEDETYTIIIDENQRKYTIEEDGTLTEGEYNKWNGIDSVEPTEKTSNEIHIYTAAQLKWLANQVNNEGILFEGYIIYLENNLDFRARNRNGSWENELNEALKWIPIGKEKTALFEFDGKSHIIKGLYVNETTNQSGIFGNSNTIRNVTIKNSYIKGTNCVGGIIGALRSGIIDNCHNENTTVISTGYICGGIVAQSLGDKILNCSNNGEIMANGTNTGGVSYAGGIAGSSYYSSIYNCNNIGKVMGVGHQVGGITSTQGYKNKITELKGCYNKGEIIAINGQSVGGIAGCTVGTVTVSNSYNMAYVQALEGAGGIIGESKNSGNDLNIDFCYNGGKVEGNSDLGGIIGYIRRKTKISNCYNKGKIKYKGTEKRSGEIIGTVSTNELNIFKCYYLKNEDNNSGIGCVADGIDLEQQINEIQITNVDNNSYEEFLSWIEE